MLEAQIKYVKCFSCHYEFLSDIVETLSCNHILCYRCLSLTLLKSEFKSLDSNNISFFCFCHKGKLELKPETFIERSKALQTQNCITHHKPGDKYCLNCKSWLCEQCYGGYHKSFDKMHRFEDIFNYNKRSPKCWSHSKKVYFYCTECKEEQCNKCVDVDNVHDMNNKRKIKEVVHEKINTIEKELMIQSKEDLVKIIGNNEMNFKNALQKEYYDRKSKIEYAIKTLKEQLVILKEKYDKESTYSKNLFSILDLSYNNYFSLKSTKKGAISLYDNILSIERELERISISTSLSDEIDLIVANVSNINPKSLVQCHLKFQELKIKDKNEKEIIINSNHTEFMSVFFKLNEETYISGALDKNIHIYSKVKDTLEYKEKLQGHKSGINCAVALNNGRFATGSHNSEIIIWDLSKDKIVLDNYKGCHKGCVRSLAYIQYSSQDNKERLFSCGDDGNVFVWDINKGQIVKKYSDADCGGMNCILAMYNGIIAVVGYNNGNFSVFNGRTLDIVKTCDSDKDNDNSEKGIVCMKEIKLKGEKVAIGLKGNKNNLKIINPEKKFEVEYTLGGHENWVSCIIQTKEGFLVSGGRDEKIRVWNLDNRQCIRTLSGHCNTIVGLCLTKKNELLGGGADGLIKIWINGFYSKE